MPLSLGTILSAGKNGPEMGSIPARAIDIPLTDQERPSYPYAVVMENIKQIHDDLAAYQLRVLRKPFSGLPLTVGFIDLSGPSEIELSQTSNQAMRAKNNDAAYLSTGMVVTGLSSRAVLQIKSPGQRPCRVFIFNAMPYAKPHLSFDTVNGPVTNQQPALSVDEDGLWQLKIIMIGGYPVFPPPTITSTPFDKISE
jgi:hypothetical protein